MDLKRLKHLVALAEERNFARAAKRVHLSQPAFSRSIQAAEAELGLRLFDRGTSEIAPTRAGTFVIGRARKLVFAGHCLDRDVELYRNKLTGGLAMGFGPFPAATLLHSLLPELRQDFPGIQLKVEVSNSGYLAQHLRDEELDFFVADARSFFRSEDLEISPLAKLFAGFYVRAGHPIAAEQPVSPAELVSFGLASVVLSREARDILSRRMALDPDSRLPLSLESDDVPTLKRIVLHSDAILVTVHAAVSDEVAAGKLVPLSVTGTQPLYSELGIISLRGRSHSPVAEVAIERLRTYAQQFTEMHSSAS